MKSINGVFWTKNNPEIKVNGILKITESNKVSLSLKSNFTKDNIKYIYGLTESNQKISLLNSFVKSYNFDFNSENILCPEYEVEYLVENQFVDLDYFIDKINIEISGLFDLVKITKWDTSEILVKDFENDFFGVNMSFVGLIEKVGTKEIRKSYIVLKGKEKEDFFYWKDKLDEFYQYFSILLNANIQIKCFKNSDINLISNIIKDNFDRDFNINVIKMLPEKNDVFIKNFTSKYPKFREVFQRHNYLVTSSIISELRLVLSISSLEVIYNTLYSNKRFHHNRKDTFIHKTIKKRNDKICMWEKIEYLIDKYWEESLKEVFTSRETLESYLIDKAVTIRNNVIHPQISVSSKIENYYIEKKEEYFKDFVKTADCCFYFMKVIVLKELGVDIKDYTKELRIRTLIQYD